MKKLGVIVSALILITACSKQGSQPDTNGNNDTTVNNPTGNPHANDSFWTGKVYRHAYWPPQYPGVKRIDELQFISGSRFTQRDVEYQNGDSIQSYFFHSFIFDSTSGYITITSGNNPPTLSSYLLQYIHAGDSILAIGIHINAHDTDTINLGYGYLRVK